MALSITSDCINCGVCLHECQNNAIAETGDIHVIDPNRCTECEDRHDEPQCVGVCAVDCIVPRSEAHA